MKTWCFLLVLGSVLNSKTLIANAQTQASDQVSLESFKYTEKNFNYLIDKKIFSPKLLSQHLQLYKGYVNQTNTLLTLIMDSLKKNPFSLTEYSALKKAFGFEYNGMKLHEFYFENLASDSIQDSKSPLYSKISEDFGDFDTWKLDFTKNGMVRGIGWVILYYDKTANKLLNAWIESHDKGVPVFDEILLVMDCWEHAYLLDYGINRAEYINTFMSHIDWSTVSKRFEAINEK